MTHCGSETVSVVSGQHPRILYVCEDFVAVDKPTGITVIPDRLQKRASCLRQIVSELLQKPVYPVHRLDRDTSGVVLFALSSDAQKFLSAQFSQNLVEKKYLALVHGHPAEKVFRCDLPIGEGRKGKMRIMGRRPKEATTDFEVLAYFSDEKALVLAKPKTGRRHQIRLHLAACGYPIVGDKTYYDAARVLAGVTIENQENSGKLMLHAHSISIKGSPGSDKVTISAPLPSWVPQELHGVLKL